MSQSRGPMKGIRHVEKAKDFKGTLAKLISYMGVYRIGIIAVILFAIGGTAFNIVGPKILGEATTEIFEGIVRKISGGAGIDFNRIARILIILALLYITSACLSFIQGWIMSGIAQKLAFKLRKEISEKINRMPFRYFESKTVGEVLSRITNDIDTLGQNLNQNVSQLITASVTIIGVVIMMLTINVVMTAIAFIVLPVAALLIGLVVKNSQKFFKTQQEYLGRINGQVEEVYGGHRIIKAFGKEEAMIERFDETNKVLFDSAWRSQFISGMMQPMMTFIGNLGYVAVAVSGGLLAIRGAIEVGDIQAFIQYVRSFNQPITQVAQISNLLQSMAAAAERVFEFLDEEEEEQFAVSPASIKDIKGAVCFEHVRFGYEPNKTIIRNFNCQVAPGQTVAIVGPTGAGKTTIIKLLMRFYDVTDGCIKLDGHNLKDFNRRELRHAFGMVLQETWLFKGSIMENIRYGRLEATDDQVIAAAKAAHAHHFIEMLPEGYQTELNEEASNISAGQKQLLTIARAILADNKVLILDEATSSVDTRTEISIQRAMNNLMEGRTSFVIAHRLSTIKDADVILVMKEGDIIEQGNHETLLAKNGAYAALYNAQFEEAME